MRDMVSQDSTYSVSGLHISKVGWMQQNPEVYFYSPDVVIHTSYFNKTDPEALGHCSEIFFQ